MLHIISTRCENVAIELDRSGFTTIECEPAIRSRGSVGNAQLVTGLATSGQPGVRRRRGGAGGRQGRPCSRCRPQPGRRRGPGRASGRSPRASAWRNGPRVSDVTGLATASPAPGPGWRALGRARQVGRRRPGRVPRMLPHPGFEIPDAFLQPDDRCPLLGDCRPKLNNQCLQGGDHG